MGEERTALIESLESELDTAYGLRWNVDPRGVVMTIMPIIDKHLTTRAAPDSGSGQWNPLLRVLVDEFGGLVPGESAAETVIRLLRGHGGSVDGGAIAVPVPEKEVYLRALHVYRRVKDGVHTRDMVDGVPRNEHEAIVAAVTEALVCTGGTSYMRGYQDGLDAAKKGQGNE